MQHKPHTLKAHLDTIVIGQEEAKKTVSVAGYMHYVRFMKDVLEDNGIKNYKKSNIMLLGPSGSGKTLLARELAKQLGFPMCELSATDITPTGFHGRSLGEHLGEFFVNSIAEFGVTLTDYSIIFVDEIDKLCQSVKTTNSDDWFRTIQTSLLKAVEGYEMPIEVHGKRENLKFNTSNLLFIFAGNFEWLRMNRESDKKRPIGFVDNTVLAENHLQVELIKAGIIPELVGRIASIVELEELSEEALIQILTDSKSSPLQSYLELFDFLGYNIKIEDTDFKKIAQKCIKLKIGARGLQTELERELKEVIYNIK